MTDDLPGVILRFRGAEQMKTQMGKKRVRVIVEAEISDDGVWSVVEQKLKDGLKVYSADDFQGELLEALRKEHGETEKKIKALEAGIKEVTAENHHMKLALSVLHGELESG